MLCSNAFVLPRSQLPLAYTVEIARASHLLECSSKRQESSMGDVEALDSELPVVAQIHAEWSISWRAPEIPRSVEGKHCWCKE